MTTEATHDQILAAKQYVRRIKKKAKKAYARRYMDHLLGEAPEPPRGELSVMGAQAVRLSLEELLKGA